MADESSQILYFSVIVQESGELRLLGVESRADVSSLIVVGEGSERTKDIDGSSGSLDHCVCGEFRVTAE